MIELFDENFGLSISEVMQKIASQLGVEYDVGEIKVVRNEREYLMFIYHGERGYRVGTQSFLEIKTKIPQSHPFFGIKKSGSFDWIAENILCMADFQIGDEKFDTQFNIRVGDKAWGNLFLSKISIRAALSNLLFHGFDLVYSEDGYLKAIKYVSVGDPYPTVEMIQSAIENMDQVISNFPIDYEPSKTKDENNLLNYSSDDIIAVP